MLSISEFLAYSGTDFHPTDDAPLRAYKSDARRRRLPQAMSKQWLFSFIDSEAGNGKLSLASKLRSEAQEEADRIYDYQKSHRDILHDPETAKVVNQLLESVR